MNRMATGVICTLAGAVLWGFSGTCSEFLFDGYGISGITLTALRMSGAGILFLLFLVAAQRKTLTSLLRNPAAVRGVLAFGIAGLFLNQYTYLMTISFTNAGTATVMQSFNIPIIMVFTCIVARRRPALTELCGLAMALASVYLISTGGNPAALAIPAAGLIWGMANAAATAFYTLQPRRLFAQYGSAVVTGLGMCAGGVMSLVVWAIEAAVSGAAASNAGATSGADAAAASSSGAVTFALPALDASGILALLAVIVLGTCGAFWLFLHGVSLIGGMRASMLGAAEPVSATALSATWLHTAFSAADWIGLVLMVGTIIITAIPAHGQGENDDVETEPTPRRNGR